MPNRTWRSVRWFRRQNSVNQYVWGHVLIRDSSGLPKIGFFLLLRLLPPSRLLCRCGSRRGRCCCSSSGRRRWGRRWMVIWRILVGIIRILIWRMMVWVRILLQDNHSRSFRRSRGGCCCRRRLFDRFNVNDLNVIIIGGVCEHGWPLSIDGMLVTWMNDGGVQRLIGRSWIRSWIRGTRLLVKGRTVVDAVKVVSQTSSSCASTAKTGSTIWKSSPWKWSLKVI